MTKADIAAKNFEAGYNCAQSVLLAFCEDLCIDEEEALKISCGFGGGMGGQGETCGAVSGAYMIIGLKYGRVKLEDKQAKEKTYLLIREFAEKFKKKNRYISCRELLGMDLLSEEKTVLSERKNKVCPQMVRDAAEIVEEFLE